MLFAASPESFVTSLYLGSCTRYVLLPAKSIQIAFICNLATNRNNCDAFNIHVKKATKNNGSFPNNTCLITHAKHKTESEQL